MGFFSKAKNTNPDCGRCGLYKEATSKQMGVFGQGRKGIMILTKAPSAQQDRANNLLVGDATDMFRREIAKHGISLDEDCFVVSALGCKTHRKTEAAKKDAKKCLPRIEKYIKKYKPKMIVCLGAVALNQMAGKRFADVSIDTYQGHCLPDYENNCWLGALPHPSSLMQVDDYDNTLYNDKYYMKYYEMMLKEVFSYMGKELPLYHDVHNKVEIITEYRDVITILRYLQRGAGSVPYSYDYETNTALSFLPESSIKTVAVAPNPDIVYSFPMDFKNIFTPSQLNDIKNEWVEVIKNPNRLKTVHNVSLEYNYDANILGVDVPNYFDTMIAAHQENTAPGTKSLKYQLSMKFGVEEYDADVHPYLVPNSILEYNRIEELPINKVLHYNGIDALGGYWLYQQLSEKFKCNSRRKYKWRDCMQMYQRGIIALCRSHRRGVDLDLDFLREEEKSLLTERDEYIKKVHESREGKLYKEKTGQELEITNNNEIGKLVYEYLGIEPKRKTATGKGQVTKEAMEELGLGFVDDLLTAKKIEKHTNDFVSKLLHNNVDGRIYPEIGISHARSGRSNAFGLLNIQQVPKRSDLGKRVRRGFRAPEGYRIGSSDLSSVEISSNACCSSDPLLKQYIRDPSSDPHGDSAKSVFMMNDRQITKEIRQSMKSNFMFLLFYRGYPTSAAKRIFEMWDHTMTGEGITLHEHMKIRGIDSFFDLKDHIIEQADLLWERFPVFHAYQSSKENEYFERGYVENPAGFRRGGWITPNQSVNTPGQNLSFTWLLSAYIDIDDWLIQSNKKSYLWGQIHDDILSVIHDDEKQEVIDGIQYYMTKHQENKYDYLDIPLKADPEISPLNGSWYEVAPWIKDENGVWKPKEK